MRSAIWLSVAVILLLGNASRAAAAEPHLLRIELQADADGELTAIRLDGQVIERPQDGKQTRAEVLAAKVRDVVENDRGQRREGTFIAELRCDPQLKYAQVKQVMQAIAWYACDGQRVLLVDKIKFAPQP